MLTCLASAALIVRCANCQTEFSLDDRQVGPEGASLRCSLCGYVFRVEPRKGGAAPWQIRTVDDMHFFAADLKTLKSWIAEGRLHPDDQVSRTGKHWLRLGDMPEFSDAFAGYGGLPEVFTPIESPAVDELGPPPTFGGADGSPDAGIPQLTAPPPTGAIHLEPTAGGAVIKRYGARSLPSQLGTEPVLDAPRTPPPEPPPSQIPTEQAPRGGELISQDASGDDLPLADFLLNREREPSQPQHASPPDSDDGIVVRRSYAAVESSGARPVSGPVSGPTSGPTSGSMLGAVTSSIVKPVTRPPIDPSTAASIAPPLHPPVSRPPPDFDDERTTARRTRVIDDDALDRRRRRSSWPLVAGLGALAGIAVVFGIPDIRNRVFGLAGGIVGEPSASATSDDARAIASAALASIDPTALEDARGELRKRTGDPIAAASAAEITATQVLLAAIEARIAGRRAAPPPAELQMVAADAAADPRAVVLIALARGDNPDASAAGREVQLIAASAPLWRDAQASVPAGVIGGLEATKTRSGLGSLVLALAYWRGGDERRALELATAILERAPAQPAALALVAELGGTEASVGDAAGDAVGDVAQPVAPDDPPQAPEVDTAAPEELEPPIVIDDADPKTAEPRESIDKMIERGCEKVEAGDAAGAIKVLERAHSRRPADIDAMVCLGQAYARMGSHSAALKLFERALDRAPQQMAALRGAARSAARLGQTSKAIRHYEDILASDSTNTEAKTYVDKHKGGSSPPAGEDPAPASPPPPTDPAPGSDAGE